MRGHQGGRGTGTEEQALRRKGDWLGRWQPTLAPSPCSVTDSLCNLSYPLSSEPQLFQLSNDAVELCVL